ncbi:cytochrome P450 71AU50-like [Salvia splendens]|uniref:cytochrome P450 71AU50-like n=1 Tax=Salvia splendens TaxID=180675 RepID=UPI001C27586F|nr:cytochrome P450 71AU50-like [Salvia splendens]
MAEKKKNNVTSSTSAEGASIIGHIHLLGKNPHQDFRRLAQQHGEIMHMRLGSLPIVVVSSPAAAKLVLKTHDAVLSDRPHYLSTTRLTYGHRDVICAPCGPYWRNMRKLCTLELLSGPKVEEFQPMRRAELGMAVEGIRRAAEGREVVDVSARVGELVGDMNCLMVLGGSLWIGIWTRSWGLRMLSMRPHVWCAA